MPLFRKPGKISETQANVALRVLAAEGDKESVLEKLGKGARLIPDKDGRTALHIAAAAGYPEIVAIFLKVGVGCDVNLQDKLGYTAIQRAALQGHAEVVRLLLDVGADVNKKDFVQENTAMHEAAAEGHEHILQLLHAANADFYVRNKIGATALHVSAQKGRTSVVRWFLQKRCKVDVKDKYDDTPLHTAIRHLHSGAAKVLLTFGAPTNDQNKNGDTPLHLSCNLGQKKLTKLLVQAGASCNLKNKQNETAKDIAGRRQSSELNNIIQRTPVKQPGMLSPIGYSPAERKQWKRTRKSKIRARLEEAKKTGSNWHLLFQDWAPREATALDRERWEPQILRKGEQFFVDLAGNIQKGPSGNPVACYCAPFFCNMVKENTEAQQELLDEIDACHDDLSHEINDLRQVTKRHLADIERDLETERRTRNNRRGDEKKRQEYRARKLRSRSESELDVDGERGNDGNESDSLSNASDDIYLERYWKATTRQSSSQDSQSRDSRKAKQIRDTFQETLKQFNRLDLDDSCTTPTSGSSQPYTGTPTSHSEMSQPAKTPSRRVSLYSCRSTNSAGKDCPQPPSLDSGYGTGMSPSPAVSRSEQNSTRGTIFNSSTLPMLIEACTQTDTGSSHEYTELEGHTILGRKSKRLPPKLIIPPPPRHPLPPLPTEVNQQKTSAISTDV